MKRTGGMFVIAGLLFALPAMAASINIGYISFDDGDPTFGQAAIGLSNSTGPNAINGGCSAADFAVCDSLSFTNVMVTVDYVHSSTPLTFVETLPGPFGPGLYDPLDGTNLVFDDSDTFTSITVTLNFAPTTFSVIDGGGNQSLYQSVGNSATAVLLAPDPTMFPTALLTIDANPVTTPVVPEPASAALAFAGLGLVFCAAARQVKKHQ